MAFDDFDKMFLKTFIREYIEERYPFLKYIEYENERIIFNKQIYAKYDIVISNEDEGGDIDE